MRDLMARGKPYKCDFLLTDQGTTTKSVLYVNGKQIRMEGSAVISQDKPELKSHMILSSDDNFAYIWMEDGTGNGTKFKMEDSTAKTTGATGTTDVSGKWIFLVQNGAPIIQCLQCRPMLNSPIFQT